MVELEAEVWILHAFDVARAISLDACAAVTTQQIVGPRRREWPHLFGLEQRPLLWQLEPVDVALSDRAITVRPRAVIYGFGHVSVELCAAVTGSPAAWRDLAVALAESEAVVDLARDVVGRVLQRAAAALRDPRPLGDHESYVVFHLAATPGDDAAAWLETALPAVAEALRLEVSPLSAAEIVEATARRISYLRSDLVVIDSEAALVVDRDAEETLAVLDFANCERLALRVVDEDLDVAVGDAGGLVRSRASRWRLFFAPWGREVTRLTQLTLDAAVELEAVDNAIKLTGDHYLARLYRMAVERFHLRPFHEGIGRKLGTLWSLQKVFIDKSATQRLELLEWIVIALIAFEVIRAVT